MVPASRLPAAEQDVPAAEFRAAMGHFATGVTVVTSVDADAVLPADAEALFQERVTALSEASGKPAMFLDALHVLALAGQTAPVALLPLVTEPEMAVFIRGCGLLNAKGDTLKFDILHEDWGDGERPTFAKHVTAHVGWNEMRATTAADHQPPPPPRPAGFVPGFSLQGPIPIEATAGNVWPEWPPKNTSSPR